MAALVHPALRTLWRLQLKASWRKLTRSARSGKGLLRLGLTIGLMSLTFGPMIVFSFFRDAPDPAMARAVLEPGIFVLTLLILIGNGANNGVFFTPPEVDFLFSGPFRRRELLLYRAGHQVQASLFGALFLSVVPAPFVPHWVFAFVGLALVLQFMQLLSTVMGLTTSIIGQAAYTRARKVALVVVGALIVFAIGQAAAEHAFGSLAMLKEFPSTPVGRILLLPFQIFSRTIAAESFFPDFLGWGLLALGTNAWLLVLTLRLDTDFYERSMAVSERIYRAIENAKRGQAWMNLSRPSATRWHLPMPARLRGAGPIAWRQSVSALRSSRGVIYVVIFIAAMVAVAAYFLRESGAGMAATGLIMFALFTFPQMLQFDFRGDIERIDVLKTLPAPTGAIVAGELMVPITMATIIDWALVVGTGPLWADWNTIFVACAFVPAANLIVFAIENLVFLYYPRRPSNTGIAFQSPGRQMVINFIKVIVTGVIAGVTVGFGALAFWISGDSMNVALVTAWCVAAALGMALVPQVARAFRVLDPSLETME
jgi:hypothetical protein